MANVKIVLKGAALLERSGQANVHQLGLKARLGAQTAHKYLSTPEAVKSVDLDVLARLLLDGLELTPDQVLDLRLGELFDLAPAGPEPGDK